MKKKLLGVSANYKLKKNTILAFCVYVDMIISVAVIIRRAGLIALVTR